MNECRNRPRASQAKKAQRPLHLKTQAAVDRNRPPSRRPFVAGRLDGIVIEGRVLVLGHAVGRRLGRNMRVAQPLDVGEDLVGAGAADRAGDLEGLAGQHVAGLELAGV